MDLLKKAVFVPVLFFSFAAVVLAQQVVVSSEAGFRAAMESAAPDIEVSALIAFTDNAGSYSGKSISIQFGNGGILFGNHSYSGFDIADSVFSVTASTEYASGIGNFVSSGNGAAFNFSGSNTLFGGTNISYNTAGGSGGGAYIDAGSYASFAYSGFYDNVAASSGGAIYSSVSSFTVAMSSFSGNEAGWGGAIFAGGSTFTITDNDFLSNSAFYEGGAIYSAASSFTSVGNKFAGNTADQGGAIFAERSTFAITGVAFSSNSASDKGGAIYSNASSFTATKNFFKDNEAGYGGAMYIENSSFTVADSTFTGNTAYFDGGAVYMTGSYGTIDGIEVSSNTSGWGGGVYVRDGSFAEIKNSIISSNTARTNAGGLLVWDSVAKLYDTIIDSNTAVKGGGAYAGSGSFLEAQGSSFVNNTASQSGGAVYAKASTFTFTDSFFSGNMTENGGALYSERSSFTVAGSVFDGNKASGTGGAIYAEKSTFTITDSFFTGNESAYGGIIDSADSNFAVHNSSFSNNLNTSEYASVIYAVRSTFTIDASVFAGNDSAWISALYSFEENNFTVTNSTFSGNSGDVSTIYLSNGSYGKFDGVNVSGNSVLQNGGGIGVYGESSAEIKNSVIENNSSGFTGGGLLLWESSLALENVTVSGNSSRNGGGIDIEDSIFSAKGIVFSSNAASISGGGIRTNEDVSAHISDSEFLYNTAVSSGGGAFVEGDSEVSFLSSGFKHNIAGDSGGAVYAYESGLTIADTDFTDNSAGNYGGALYLSDSYAGISAENKDLLFSGNTASSTPNDIYMENSTLALEARGFDIKMEGGIVSSGTANIIEKTYGGTFYLGGINDIEGTFDLSEGSMKMINGSALSVQNFNIAENAVFETSGTVTSENITVDGDLSLLDFESGAAGNINTENMTIGSNARIVSKQGAKLVKGSYDFGTLVTYSGMLNGAFSEESTARMSYKFDYLNGEVNLAMDVLDYADIKGLSGNQKEVAKVFDALYDDAYAEQGDWWNKVFSKTDLMSAAELKKIEDEIAGSFIANALTVAAFNSGKELLFNSINPGEGTDLWIQAHGGQLGYAKDDNTNGDFKDTNYGVNAGWDFIRNETCSVGFMLGYTGHSLEQKDDSGSVNDTGIGAYAGWFKDSIEVKGVLRGGYQTYETERKISLTNEKAKGDFSGYSVNAGAVAGYKIPLMEEKLSVKPFVGFDLGMAANESYKESGAVTALEVDSGNYMRADALIGAGFEGTISKVKWFADLGLTCLLSGDAPEAESSMSGAGMKISGAEQGSVQGNIAAGANYEINEKLGVYASLGYAVADNYDNANINAGVSYRLGK